jgi:hypothetical protein
MKKLLRTIPPATVALLSFAMSVPGRCDTLYRVFASNCELLHPVLLVAPDLSDSGGVQGDQMTVVEGIVVNGKVVDVQSRIGDDSSLKDVISRWRFAKRSCGEILVLRRINVLPATKERVFETSELDGVPGVITRAIPSYPHNVREVIPWKCDVEVVVGKDGLPLGAVASNNQTEIFRRNAVGAALLWRFEIGKVKGESVCYRRLITVKCDLDNVRDQK